MFMLRSHLIVRPIGRAAARCVRTGVGAELHFGQTNFRAVLAKRTSRQRSMVRPIRVAAARRVRAGGTELHFGQTNFASARIWIASVNPER